MRESSLVSRCRDRAQADRDPISGLLATEDESEAREGSGVGLEIECRIVSHGTSSNPKGVDARGGGSPNEMPVYSKKSKSFTLSDLSPHRWLIVVVLLFYH